MLSSFVFSVDSIITHFPGGEMGAACLFYSSTTTTRLLNNWCGGGRSIHSPNECCTYLLSSRFSVGSPIYYAVMCVAAVTIECTYNDLSPIHTSTSGVPTWWRSTARPPSRTTTYFDHPASLHIYIVYLGGLLTTRIPLKKERDNGARTTSREPRIQPIVTQ